MLPNYATNKDGLIYQIDKTPFEYNEEYVKVRYDTYGDLNKQMSHLRLGYVFGSTGIKVNSILDVGYGNGAFLKVCEGIIQERSGYDVSGYKVPEGVFFDSEWIKNSGLYDVITFFDVLEHFENPYIIRDLNCKYIVVSLPWCHYLSDEWFENWKHRRPNEHLWFFDHKTIYSFAESCGYEVINHCNVEDVIRKPNDGYENILTFCLKRIR